MKAPAAALVLLVALAGCSSSDKPADRPASSGSSDSTTPPSTRDVTLTIKNEASDPRLVWVETYHPGKNDKMTDAPDEAVQIGTLAAGESVTKTFPVALRGWYRVVGATPGDDAHDRKVKFMGSVTRVKDTGEEPTVRVNR